MRLEEAEHERELPLHEELIRQERLEQLADGFKRGPVFVSEDNFGLFGQWKLPLISMKQ